VVYSLVVIGLGLLLFFGGTLGSAVALAGFVVVLAAIALSVGRSREDWFELVEGHAVAFSVLVLVAILIGGMVEIIPLVVAKKDVAAQVAHADSVWAEKGEYVFVQLPYSPLEQAGRDVYVSEGCYVCHSQMIRPFRHETLRYGEYSRADEYIYDTPFQWGSKRTGPDLMRVGGKYANLWHYLHMNDPRSTSPGSIMPSYPHLQHEKTDYATLPARLAALRKLGVPYTQEQIDTGVDAARLQARRIAADLAEQDIEVDPDSKLIALIAYLQRLGRGPQPTAAPEHVAGREGR